VTQNESFWRSLAAIDEAKRASRGSLRQWAFCF
jgi:hypothetical protein